MTIQPFPSQLLAVKQLENIQRQVSNMVGSDGSSHMMFKYEKVDVVELDTVYLIGFKP